MSEIECSVELDVDEFITTYLDLPGRSLAGIGQEAVRKNLAQTFSPSLSREIPSSLCIAFNNVLESALSTRSPSDMFYDILPGSQNVSRPLKIDICMYPRTHQADTACRIEGGKADALAAWVDLPIFVELDPLRAPFTFDDYALEWSDTELGRESQARLSRCAAEVQLHQHRLFLFSIWIQCDQARLMRWDRTAVVVSAPISLVDDSTYLVEFLLRFSSASPAQRGHDPSVELAARPDMDMLLRYEPRNQWERIYHTEMVQNLDRYPIRRITCPVADILEDQPMASQNNVFLVGRHRYAEHEPMGRGTKCYAAYDLSRRRLVFVKDFWYARHPRLQTEEVVYGMLKKSGVKNIATVIWGGDVGGQHTDAAQDIPILYHHRVIFETIGRPLGSHVDQPELIRVMRDALIAHSDAYHKAHILHGDISPANILIDIETGTGFLSDWGMALPADWASGPTDEVTRVGTWMTMSARLLQEPYKRNDLQDDLESFVHTAALMRLRFWPHDLSSRNAGKLDARYNGINTALSQHLFDVYHDWGSTSPELPSRGGQIKMLIFTVKMDFVSMAPCPLQTLITRLHEIFSGYYLASRDETPFTALDNHDAILAVFEETAQLTECSLKKSKDQFEGLCTHRGLPYERPTGYSERTMSIAPFNGNAKRTSTKRRKHKAAA